MSSPRVAVLPPARPSLTLPDKRKIVQTIWDIDVSNREEFDAFFEHYQDVIADHGFGFTGLSKILSITDLLRIAEGLKRHSSVPRKGLKVAFSRDPAQSNRVGVSSGGGGSYGTLTAPVEPPNSGARFDAGLATTIKIMFAINLKDDRQGMFYPGDSHADWNEDQSLENFLQVTFPTNDFRDEPRTPIKPIKLRASYLEAHADIQIEWTRNLPDHLTLDVGHNTKFLKVFDLSSLLDITYESQKGEQWQLPLSDSLVK